MNNQNPLLKKKKLGDAPMFDKPYLSQNRTMLWHGTKTENLMGILQNGMIIDAPHAIRCGSAFGNGIYLADTFQKSFSYSTSPNIGTNFNVTIFSEIIKNICYLKTLCNSSVYI